MSTSTIAAPAGTWQLDPVHSTAGFEVGYATGTFKGLFRDVAGTLEIDGGGAKLAGSAQVASIDVRDENLAAHLQSPDFFDAENHPAIAFEADRVALGGASAEVAGRLTMRGVTRDVVATGSATDALTDAFGNERVGLVLETTVDRTAFGLNWNMDLPGGGKALEDDVTIKVELYFVKAA